MDCKREVDNICEWISEYVKNACAKGVVIGVSGGIDSAVVAALCARALGVENVFAVMMPPNDNARMIVDEFNLSETVSYNTFLSISEDICLRFLPEDRINDLVKGNISSRLRMVCLYAWANALNYLVAGTTNKSELLTFYYTKYGDGGVDFEPIADYYKTEVYELAEYLGIPQEVIDAEPSAGLWQDQTDKDELGMDYTELDYLLEFNELHGRDSHSPDDPTHKKLEIIRDMFRKSYHKQYMPPSYKRK